MAHFYESIFTTACGTYLGTVDHRFQYGLMTKKNRVIALASTNLWSNLTLTEIVNNLFFDSALSTVKDSFKTEPILRTEDDRSHFLDVLFEKIEKSLLSNVDLVAQYKERKCEAERIPVAQLENVTFTSREVLFKNNSLYRQLVARRTFTEYGVCLIFDSTNNELLNFQTKFQRHILAMTMLKLAKTTKANLVQEIFDNAVGVAVNKQSSSLVLELRNDVEEITETLFSKINRVFEANPNLKEEMVAVKTELVKNYGL